MEIENLNTADLIPYARNARTHSDEQVAQIAGSIREFGFTNPVLIDADNGIIAGHGRVMAAHKLGLKELPCIRLGYLTEAQKRAYIIADNQLALNAGWDEELLALELNDLKALDFDLDLLGFDNLDELLGFKADKEFGDPDEIPEVPEEPITKTGDIWILGDHRLMCGDSTDTDNVLKLMDSQKASLVVTDPPYGVSYADKNAFLNSISPGNRIQTPIENDHGSIMDMSALWFAVYKQIYDVLCPGGVLYSFGPQGGELSMMMMMMMKDAGIMPRHSLIWVKNNHVLGRTDYAYKHEPIIYTWKDGGHKFYGDFQTSVIEYPRPQSSDLHPTMKPVGLIKKLICNSSKINEVLFEPFSGSGTTIIAAENTDRKCFAMELSPHYVDVAVKRWQDFTGKEAVRESDGKLFNDS